MSYDHISPFVDVTLTANVISPHKRTFFNVKSLTRLNRFNLRTRVKEEKKVGKLTNSVHKMSYVIFQRKFEI